MTGMLERVRAAYLAAGLISHVHIDLLYQCDLDCLHCYLDDKVQRLHDTAFWKDVLDQLAELQVLDVTLSGGELLLRKDALDLIAHARSRGLLVHLKTHAGRIDDAAADRLAALGVSTISVSYYATDPAVHDAITRRPGSHDRTWAAIRRLAERGVNVKVSCPVMAANRHAYPDVVRACGDIGVPVALTGHIFATHGGEAFPADAALTAQEQSDLEAFMATLEAGCGKTPPGARWEDASSCGAGRVTLYVSPQAEVRPCVIWPQPLGRLTDTRLADIVARSPALARIRSQRRRDRDVCAGCALREQCDYCPGQAFTDSGDPTRPVRSICESTWARAKARARLAGDPEPPRPPGLDGPEPPRRFRVLSAAEARAAEREAGQAP